MINAHVRILVFKLNPGPSKNVNSRLGTGYPFLCGGNSLESLRYDNGGGFRDVNSSKCTTAHAFAVTLVLSRKGAYYVNMLKHSRIRI